MKMYDTYKDLLAIVEEMGDISKCSMNEASSGCYSMEDYVRITAEIGNGLKLRLVLTFTDENGEDRMI